MAMPTITLTTGVKVANFSSPHSFKFEDGSVLPACSPERAREMMLRANEDRTPSDCERWEDIALRFEMSDVVREALEKAQAEDVDIVLVPFPVMTAAKAAGIDREKLRCIRSADRVKKTIHHDAFCV